MADVEAGSVANTVEASEGRSPGRMIAGIRELKNIQRAILSFEDTLVGLKRLLPCPPLKDEATCMLLAEVMDFLKESHYAMILGNDGPCMTQKRGTKALRKPEDGEDVVTDNRKQGEYFALLSLMGRERRKAAIIAAMSYDLSSPYKGKRLFGRLPVMCRE